MFRGVAGRVATVGPVSTGRVMTGDRTPAGFEERARAALPDCCTPREFSLAFRFAKRLLDIVLALVLLVVTLPLFIVIAVLIKSTSSGPVFFTQARVGRGERTFTLVKFRTMLSGTHDAVLGDEALRRQYVENGYKLPPEAGRVTGVGRLLRKTSLDELPQLVNIVMGQMSMVGIRPLVGDEYGERSSCDRAAYASLRPGLTGLWQVEGRSALQHHTRIELDREYAESCTLFGDLKILLRTPRALLRLGETH